MKSRSGGSKSTPPEQYGPPGASTGPASLPGRDMTPQNYWKRVREAAQGTNIIGSIDAWMSEPYFDANAAEFASDAFGHDAKQSLRDAIIDDVRTTIDSTDE
jgi:hypothetical protein